MKITKRGGVGPLPSLVVNMFFWLNKILHLLKMASQTVQRVRNGWAPEIKRLNDNLEKLEASLSGTDECVLDIYSLEETLQDKIHLLDVELTTVKAENIEMKNHFNSMAKQLNEITALVNQKYGYRIIEETYGFDEIDRGATPPPNSPRDTGYNLRSHVIDME